MINEVRNTVLSVLNKNNYGYISPSDFNLFAENAQMELFEEYFINYNKAINAENARTAGSDYAEVEGPLAETVEGFLITKFLAHLGGNKYSIPSLTTTGDTAYYILKMICHTKELVSGNVTSVVLNTLQDTTATFLSDGITEGDIVVNTVTDAVSNVLAVVSNNTITLTSNIFLVNGQGYKIISQAEKEADKVSVGKITMLNASSLTSPTEFYPSYTFEEERITLFPKTIDDKGKVKAVYFRHPKTPKWTYTTLLSGEPSFNQTQIDYQDFELPYEDTYRLVMKILQYCGISIREMEVAQFGMVQEQQNNQQ
tara:strand:- start:7603 stop:8538 length:936 start_codon:yes stop_codon:yes gene_type:complete